MSLNSRAAWLGVSVLLAAAPLALGAPSSSLVKLRVVDQNSAQVPARLRVLNAEGQPQPVEVIEPRTSLAIHPNFPELGVVVEGQAEVALSPGKQTLVIDRGTEYRPVNIAIDAKPDEVVEKTAHLERWIRMAEKGWWSGDLHLHRAPAEITELMQASDLHFAPTLTCWNDTQPATRWGETTVFTDGPDRAYSIANCEDERRWGAGLFLGLKSPLQLYGRDAQYPPPVTTWSEARSRGAYIDLEKLIWWDAPVMAALNPPDSIGVAVNHFREDGVSTRASLSRPRDETRYPGELGFAQYVLDLYSTYLSAGLRIPASGGSANGVAKIPFGYNRSYVYLGDNFSYDGWLAGQKAGRNFVTNGPMLFATVNGEMPGAILPDGASEVKVQFDAYSATELDRLEVVVDGQVVNTTRPASRTSEISNNVTAPVKQGSWIAVRCFEKNQVTIRLAHTSPFYVGKTARRSSKALAYLREWIQADQKRIEEVTEDKLTKKQKAEILAGYKKALAFYADR